MLFNSSSFLSQLTLTEENIIATLNRLAGPRKQKRKNTTYDLKAGRVLFRQQKLLSKYVSKITNAQVEVDKVRKVAFNNIDHLAHQVASERQLPAAAVMPSSNLEEIGSLTGTVVNRI